MSVSSVSGPWLSTAGFQVGSEASPINVIDSSGNFVGPSVTQNLPLVGTYMGPFQKLTTAIADSVATTILTITMPNVNGSFVARVLVRSAITNSSHKYDSTRVQEVLIVGTRVAGAAMGAGISAAIGAQIATVSAGQTITAPLTIAVAGGATADNTVALQITPVNASAGTSEAHVACEILEAIGTLVSLS